MKWAEDWQSKRDTPWEAIICMVILLALLVTMLWIGDNGEWLKGWIDPILEALR